MIWIWLGFIAFVLAMLALDLGVFHRQSKAVSVRDALAMSAVWIALALSFGVLIYFGYEYHWLGLGMVVDPVDHQVNTGATATVKYLTGYVVEKSLSIDNIFVISMLFRFFAVPAVYQHRVLYWGILGALVMRGVMIAAGTALIAQFHWVLYLFGGFLILTGVKMLVIKSDETDPSNNIVVRIARRFLPITDCFHGQWFFVRAHSEASRQAEVRGADAQRDEAVERAKPGTFMLTPLALALIVVESTDLIFAVDSIPAIFAITTDPFLVFTSNVFAILGLRSLYFALAGMIDTFRYLKVSLALVLVIVGVKMLVADWLKESLGKNFNFYLLGVVLLTLAGGVIASLLAGRPRKDSGTEAK